MPYLKPPLKLEHGWVITSLTNQWMWLLIHASTMACLQTSRTDSVKAQFRSQLDARYLDTSLMHRDAPWPSCSATWSDARPGQITWNLAWATRNHGNILHIEYRIFRLRQLKYSVWYQDRFRVAIVGLFWMIYIWICSQTMFRLEIKIILSYEIWIWSLIITRKRFREFTILYLVL